VVSATDANGSVTASAYDALDRVTARAITRAVGVLGTTSEVWKYDGLSRSVHAANDDSIVTREYDSLSDLTGETQQFALGSWDLKASFDGVGNKISVTYSAPFASPPSVRTVTTTYDALNREKTISEGGAVAAYDYIGPNRVERRDSGNNTRATYDYDGVRRPTRVTHAKIGPPTLIDDRTFAWDPKNNKTSRADLLPGGVTHGYSYDSADRLIHSAVPGTPIDYALDGVGNRTSVVGGSDSGFYTMSAATAEPADRQVNQYTSTAFDAGSTTGTAIS
jgi:YD repeat-containing protein